MNTSFPIKEISNVSGCRIIAQALSDSQLRFASSLHKTYAVAWRTFKSGKPHQDDGKLWLLKQLESGQYTVIYERLVLYANIVAVSDSGHVAWVKGDTHKSRTPELQVIDIDQEYIVEGERLPPTGFSEASSLVFSSSSNYLGLLLGLLDPSENRANVWDIKSGNRIATFPLLLTFGRSTLTITDEHLVIQTISNAHVRLDFNGNVITDTRFTNIKDDRFISWICYDVQCLPLEQLHYLYSAVEKLMSTLEYAEYSKTRKQDVLKLRCMILSALGENRKNDDIVHHQVEISSDLDIRLQQCVASGLYGDDVNTVVTTLLTKSLDFIQS